LRAAEGRLKPLTDLSVGAQEPLFQIMAACAARRPPGEFIWGSDA
jgi:hypothetical protein